MSYDPAGPSNPVVATRIEWVRHGSQFFTDTLDRVPDPGFVLDSLLQGWTRAHVAGHLARNADALLNLLTWARTGHETPMYGSAADRIAGINTAAARPASEIRQDVIASNARLASALELLPDRAWANAVRTARGRHVQAAEIVWMRAREVWVHAVDLNAEATFADIPADVRIALLSDALSAAASHPDTPRVHVTATDAEIDKKLGSDGPSITIVAPVVDLLPWVLGRTQMCPPEAADWVSLPAWL